MPAIDYEAVAPEGLRALLALNAYASRSLEHGLLELVKIRASQLNRCAYCIDMHTKVARAAGETEQRIYALSAWREAPFYTPRERAALEWTEALTVLGEHGVPDELCERMRKQFTERELVDLSYAVAVINTWNRLSIAFRTEVGSYQLPARRP